jgi:hypothetical protein
MDTQREAGSGTPLDRLGLLIPPLRKGRAQGGKVLQCFSAQVLVAGRLTNDRGVAWRDC